MKCPKCHYLSFEPEPRCRNCGYDLELSEDLTLRTDAPAEPPLADLSLREKDAPKRAPITLELVHSARADASLPAAAPVVAAAAGPVAPAELSEPIAAAPMVTVAPPAQKRDNRPPSTTSELPLFVKGVPQATIPVAANDTVVPFAPAAVDPMVRAPQAPRAPLAVRRSSAEPARARRAAPARKLGPLDRDLLDDLRRVEAEEHVAVEPERELAPEAVARVRPEPAPAVVGEEATISTRFAAASVDGVLLGTIALVTTWATLRLCDLEWHQINVLPVAPLAAFVLVVAAGYLLMFTIASGQTVGKMLMGIRVVPASDDLGALPLRQAAYREILSLPLVLAAGIGYLPALFGRGPAIHDRLAQTRVVRG